MAYSKDFRKKAVAYMDKGHTKEELYEAFGIYYSRIIAWRKLQKETGSFEPQYKETRERKIDLKKLKEAVERKPDATLAELAKLFKCTEQAIFYALKRAKITLKKDICLRRTICNRCSFLYRKIDDVPISFRYFKLCLCR